MHFLAAATLVIDFAVPARRRLLGLIASCLIASGPLVASAQAASLDSHPQPIDWQTSPLDLDLRGMNGERYVFQCPPGKSQPSRVAGSSPYTDDSSICTAAVHAGALRAKVGGIVAIEIRPGQTAYPGSEQNYITSMTYDRAWSGSFVVVQDDLHASAPPTH